MISALNLEVHDMLLMAGVGYYMHMHRKISLVESVVISVVVLLIKNYLLDNQQIEQIGEKIEGLMGNGIVETLSNTVETLMGNNHAGGSSCGNNKHEHLDEQNHFNPEMTGGIFNNIYGGEEIDLGELEAELAEVVNTTGVTTDVNTTGVNTTGVNTTGVNTTGVKTTNVNTTGVNTTGVNTTGVKTTNVNTTGVNTTVTVEALDEQNGGYAEIEQSNDSVSLCEMIPETNIMQCYKQMGENANCNEGVVCGTPVKYEDCSMKGGYASY